MIWQFISLYRIISWCNLIKNWAISICFGTNFWKITRTINGNPKERDTRLCLHFFQNNLVNPRIACKWNKPPKVCDTQRDHFFVCFYGSKTSPKSWPVGVPIEPEFPICRIPAIISLSPCHEGQEHQEIVLESLRNVNTY